MALQAKSKPTTKTKLPKGQQIFLCSSLGDLTNTSATVLRRLCVNGLLPGAKYHKSLGWVIDRRGASFALQWLPKQKELGSLWVEIAGKAAAKLDPVCAVRQQEQLSTTTATSLTAEDLLDIFERRDKGDTLEEIAAVYHLDQSTISKLLAGERRPIDRDALRKYLDNLD